MKFRQGLYRYLIFCTAIVIWILMTTNLNPFTCQIESFKLSTKSTTARPISCDKCFKRPYHFIFNLESICHGLTNVSVSIFVFVLTTHNQQERRDVLRNTWASLSRNNTSPFSAMCSCWDLQVKNQSKSSKLKITFIMIWFCKTLPIHTEI